MVWAVVNVHLYPFIVVEHQLDCGESQKQNEQKPVKIYVLLLVDC